MFKSNSTNRLGRLQWAMLTLAIVAGFFVFTLEGRGEEETQKQEASKTQQATAEKESGEKESATPAISKPNGDKMIDTDEIPRFGANSPFEGADKTPAVVEGKRLWAKSFRWQKAPEFVVEKWIADRPDTKGKYVMIQFWATWCGPCRRSIPLLNGFHKKFADELVVIGVSEETEEDVLKMEQPKIEYHVAVDTKKRMKDELGVWGIPHVIIVEPEGYVIWEGFPLQERYELSEQIIEKILAVGRKLKAAKEKEETRR